MLSVSVSFCLSLSFFLLAIYMIWSSLYCMIDYFIDCFPVLACVSGGVRSVWSGRNTAVHPVQCVSPVQQNVVK